MDTYKKSSENGIHKGITLYNTKSSIGFGKSTGLMIKRQGKYSAKAWPKYKRAGFKHMKPSTKQVNMKFINGLVGNPLMNS